MNNKSLENYREHIKKERKNFFLQPYDLVYKNFVDLGYDKLNKNYFKKNASEMVENLREKCWTEFKPIENEFTTIMLKNLIDEKNINKLKPFDAILYFIETYPEHIYNLTLSNTQSRRSRAGKEFESIIELILLGSGVYIDSQGNIGKQEFIKKGLGKLVDAISPGVLEYTINKRNTILISAKTTLRERWQEVPEEMDRTGAREMFLATLDTNISSEVLQTLYEANIQITTTKNIKNNYYKNNERVLTFEDLISISIKNMDYWKKYYYSEEDKNIIKQNIEKQIEKHKNHGFILKCYKEKLDKI